MSGIFQLVPLLGAWQSCSFPFEELLRCKLQSLASCFSRSDRGNSVWVGTNSHVGFHTSMLLLLSFPVNMLTNGVKWGRCHSPPLNTHGHTHPEHRFPGNRTFLSARVWGNMLGRTHWSPKSTHPLWRADVRIPLLILTSSSCWGSSCSVVRKKSSLAGVSNCGPYAAQEDHECSLTLCYKHWWIFVTF